MVFASNYRSACILVWQLEFDNRFRIMSDEQAVWNPFPYLITEFLELNELLSTISQVHCNLVS